MTWGWRYKKTATEISFSDTEPVAIYYPKTSDLPDFFAKHLKDGHPVLIFNLSAQARAIEEYLKSTGE
jgi:hypothetical protein